MRESPAKENRVTARRRNIRIPAGSSSPVPLRARIEPQTPASFGVSGRENRERQTACWMTQSDANPSPGRQTVDTLAAVDKVAVDSRAVDVRRVLNEK